MAKYNLDLVKLEPDIDFVDELVKLEQLNAIEDAKIKLECDETVIKQEKEVLESIKHEAVDIKDEMVLDIVNRDADNDPDNTLDSSVFICEYCHTNYTQRQNFESHIATHHQNVLGGLNKARLANKSKNQRRAKSKAKCVRKTTAEPPIPRYDGARKAHCCKYCNKPFAHIVNFRSHLLAAHKDQREDFNREITSKIRKCQQCDYETLRLDNFKRHMLDHSSNSLFTCEFCGKGYNIRSYLDSHLLKQHKKEIGSTEGVIVSKIYTCEICEYETVRVHDYKQHILNHHATSETRALLKCEMCEFESVHKSSLLRHSFVHSGGGKLYSCKFCEKAYKEKRTLHDHVYACHKGKIGSLVEAAPSETRTLFKCEICDFQTVHKRSLRRHNVIHSGEKNLYSCEFCERAYKHKRNLHAHVNACHKDKTGNPIARSETRALLNCEVCDFKTVHKTSLRRHNFIHSGGGKIYSCEFCEGAYKEKRTLHAHVYASHKDKTGNLIETVSNQVHQCPNCPYTTIFRSNLKRHHLATHGKVSELERITIKSEMCGYETVDTDKLNQQIC